MNYSKTSYKFWRKLSREFITLMIMATFALVAGFTLNHFREQPLPLVYVPRAERLQESVARMTDARPANPAPATGTSSASLGEPEVIDLARFHDLVGQKAAILDARPSLFYRAGHVPGAHSLARETFETDFHREGGYLAAHRQGPVVVYCSGDACVDSRMVAAGLQKLGYKQVLVFQGGWEEWQQAGLPEER